MLELDNMEVQLDSSESDDGRRLENSNFEELKCHFGFIFVFVSFLFLFLNCFCFVFVFDELDRPDNQAGWHC